MQIVSPRQTAPDTAGTIYNIIGKRIDESARRAGLILVVTITYSNTFSYNTGNFKYQYRATILNEMEFKLIEEQAIAQNLILRQRTMWNRHGFRVVFIFDGQRLFRSELTPRGSIGQFQFFNLLLSAVSSIGLLAVATVVVDIFATRVFKKKEVYREAKIAHVFGQLGGSDAQAEAFEPFVAEMHDKKKPSISSPSREGHLEEALLQS